MRSVWCTCVRMCQSLTTGLVSTERQNPVNECAPDAPKMATASTPRPQCRGTQYHTNCYGIDQRHATGASQVTATCAAQPCTRDAKMQCDAAGNVMLHRSRAGAGDRSRCSCSGRLLNMLLAYATVKCSNGATGQYICTNIIENARHPPSPRIIRHWQRTDRKTGKNHRRKDTCKMPSMYLTNLACSICVFSVLSVLPDGLFCKRVLCVCVAFLVPRLLSIKTFNSTTRRTMRNRRFPADAWAHFAPHCIFVHDNIQRGH